MKDQKLFRQALCLMLLVLTLVGCGTQPPVSTSEVPDATLAQPASLAATSPAATSAPMTTSIPSTATPTATLTVASTLDGQTTLPHRIAWQATPSVLESEVAEVDFLIDGQLTFVERHAPYTFGRDGGYLITSFLTPGEHSFTVRVKTIGGQSAESTVKAAVEAAPAPPNRLAGTSWTRTMTAADQNKAPSEPPPAGDWGLAIDSVGWMLHDPDGGGQLWDVVYQSEGEVELRTTIESPPLLDVEHETLYGGSICEEPDAPFLWAYTIGDGGKTLTLHPSGNDPCGNRVAILEGTWARESPQPFAGERAWIAYQTTYQTNRSGKEGVWLVHPDGTDDHQIATDVPGEQLLPNWSPDGTHLAVVTRGGATEPIYEYDLATKSSRQLFKCEDSCLGEDEPVYSPDGTKVAFIRYLAPFVNSQSAGDTVPSDCSLWIGEVASGKVTQITSNTKPPCDREYNPHWSPDGSHLTYWRDPYENGQPTGTAVFVIGADGKDEHRLTDPKLFAGDPDWSPDGKWIVFSTYPLNEFNFVPKVSNLYRMHPDGAGMEQLTRYATADLRATQPRYTPDGKWIIFTAVAPSSKPEERMSDRSLWAIPSEGGEPITIVQGGIYTHGTWQP